MSIPDRFSTSFRLTKTARELIENLGTALGIGKTAVVELAVRELAQMKKLKADTTK